MKVSFVFALVVLGGGCFFGCRKGKTVVVHEADRLVEQDSLQRVVGRVGVYRVSATYSGLGSVLASDSMDSVFITLVDDSTLRVNLHGKLVSGFNSPPMKLLSVNYTDYFNPHLSYFFYYDAPEPLAAIDALDHIPNNYRLTFPINNLDSIYLTAITGPEEDRVYYVTQLSGIKIH